MNLGIVYHEIYKIIEIFVIIFSIYAIYEHFQKGEYGKIHGVLAVIGVSFLIHALVYFERNKHENMIKKENENK